MNASQPYGHIYDISSPTPVPAGTFRSSRITFKRTHAATVARNVLHGFQLSRGEAITRLQTAYERPIQAHQIRDWMTSHPRIVLPILLFLLGTLTYTVCAFSLRRTTFSPLYRSLTPSGLFLLRVKYSIGLTIEVCHLMRCIAIPHHIPEYGIGKWAQRKALGRLESLTRDEISDHNIWMERHLAESALKDYLSDLPCMCVHLQASMTWLTLF